MNAFDKIPANRQSAAAIPTDIPEKRDSEKTSRPKQIDMLSGSLSDKMLKFALPLAATSILQQLFNSADLAILGRFAGDTAVAAVGSNSHIINMLINLFIGLGVGANVVMAGYVGKKNRRYIEEGLHTVFTLSLLSGAVLVLAGTLAARPMLELIGTPANVIDDAAVYLKIYFYGTPFLLIYNYSSAILRSRGDSKHPMYFLIIAGVIKVVLNLVFVAGCGMDVSGVAAATVISNGVCAAIAIIFMLREAPPFKLSFRKLGIKKRHLIFILKIGLPAGLQAMLFSISNLCIQSAINRFGHHAIAGNSSAMIFEFIVVYIVQAFGQTAVTFMSQNYAAGKLDRCDKILRRAILMALCSAAAYSFPVVLFKEPLISIFTSDPVTAEFAYAKILFNTALYFLVPVYEVCGAGLRSMGHSVLPMAVVLTGTIALRLLWVFVLFPDPETFGRLLSLYPVTWSLTSAAMATAYFIVRRKNYRLQAIHRDHDADRNV